MGFERHIEVEGTFNLRDIGDYPTRDGRRTRPGRFYRSGALHDLPQLSHLGIRTVIDLRMPDEVERDAIVCGPVRQAEGMRRIAHSLMPERVEGVKASIYLDRVAGPGMSAARYAKYLDIAAENFRTVFATFAVPDALPTVVHCTAGKDRTGVVVALVLDVLGVPPETIVDDYDLTNRSTPQLAEHLRRALGIEDASSESALLALGAPREAMEGLLQRLYAAHGSARGYLRSIGVPETTFDALEDALLER